VGGIADTGAGGRVREETGLVRSGPAGSPRRWRRGRRSAGRRRGYSSVRLTAGGRYWGSGGLSRPSAAAPPSPSQAPSPSPRTVWTVGSGNWYAVGWGSPSRRFLEHSLPLVAPSECIASSNRHIPSH
jgi:hypothetical protein